MCDGASVGAAVKCVRREKVERRRKTSLPVKIAYFQFRARVKSTQVLHRVMSTMIGYVLVCVVVTMAL